MNLSFEDHPRSQESVELVNFIIIMSIDPNEQQSRFPISRLSWIVMNTVDYSIAYQREESFNKLHFQNSVGEISLHLYFHFNRFPLLQDIQILTKAISDIEGYSTSYGSSWSRQACVMLPDEDSAILLMSCLRRYGIRAPSFLFRTYLLLNEFQNFTHQQHIDYPVPVTTNFCLHVCNNGEIPPNGLARCFSIKDALVSLLKQGHRLDSSSLVTHFNASSPFIGNDIQRHRSIDTTETYMSRPTSGFLSSPRKQGISSYASNTPKQTPLPWLSTTGPEDTPLLRSQSYRQTPLMQAMPFSENRHFSYDNQPQQSPNMFIFREGNQVEDEFFPRSGNAPEAESWAAPYYPQTPLLSWASERSHRVSIDSGSQIALSAGMEEERRRSNSMGVSFQQGNFLKPLSPALSHLSYSNHTPSIPLRGSHDEFMDEFSLGGHALPPQLGVSGNEYMSGMDFSLEPQTNYEYRGEDSLAFGGEFYKNNRRFVKPYASNLNPNSSEFVPSQDSSLKGVSNGYGNKDVSCNTINTGTTSGMNSNGCTTTTASPSSNSSKQADEKPEKMKFQRDLLEETILSNRIEDNGILMLKLRGLPYNATKQDIAAFFAPLQIPLDEKGEPKIVIGQDNTRRPSGEAFVTFASVEDCVKGLKYHLRHMGKRYIEIFPLFNKDYYRRNFIYCTICNKYGHTNEMCMLRFRAKPN